MVKITAVTFPTILTILNSIEYLEILGLLKESAVGRLTPGQPLEIRPAVGCRLHGSAFPAEVSSSR